MNTEVLGDVQGKTPAAVYLFLVNAAQSQHGSLLLQPKSCQMEPCLHASPLSWLYSRSCQFGITAFEDRWWTRDQRIFWRHQTPAGISSSTLTFFFSQQSSANASAARLTPFFPSSVVPSQRPAGERNLSSSRSPRTACALCFKPVHLIQRHLAEGKVYHRSCFR